MSTSAVTIKHIADALGLAHTTVSRALNDHPQTSFETKRKVKEAAKKLGYVANSGARLMRSGSSSLIGFIVPDVQNEFFNAVARSLAHQCARSGYQLTLGISEDDPAREHQHVRSLMENRAQGVMIAPCGHSSPATRALLAHLPNVQLLRFDPRLGKLGVCADDVGAVCDATRYLVSLGHKRIGFVGAHRDLSTGRSRVEGYRLALDKAGLPFDERLVRTGATLPAFGYEAARDLLSTNDSVSAFMVTSPRQLLGALKALREARVVVPDQVSVIGYGDTEWFELTDPPMTGVSLPAQEMSEHATSLLFSLLGQKEDEPISKRDMLPHLFKPTLVIRGSTAPVAGIYR